MADITIAGKKVPKWAAIATVVGGGVVVYIVVRNRQASAAAAAAPAASSSSQIDPATGFPAGTPADEQALAAQSSGGYGAYGTGGSYYPVDSYGYGTVGTTSAYGTNAQWAQAVESGLSSIGYAPTDISAAIGRYLAGLPVSSTQATIIYAATAEYGDPPQGAPPVTIQSSTGTAGTGATSVLAAPSVPSVTPYEGYADVSWGAVPGATVYELLIQGATGHGTGTSHHDAVQPGTHAKVTLAPGDYVARARAGTSSSNVHGHWSGDKPFTVPKRIAPTKK